MKYAFWPGCVSRGAAPELYKSTLAVAEHIGIELVELEAAACTGAGIISDGDPYLQDTLNARTLAMAEQLDLPLMDICSTCIGVHSLAREKLGNDDYRARINERLAPEGLSYSGAVEPRHLLWILLEDLERGTLNHLITTPLSELNIGPFYGCYILRPERVLGFDKHPPPPQQPGGRHRTRRRDHRHLRRHDQVLRLPHPHHQQDQLPHDGRHAPRRCAGTKGADALVTPVSPLPSQPRRPAGRRCPRHPPQARPAHPAHPRRLIGLAMGLAPEKLGLNRHVVDTKPLLAKAGL